MNVNDIISKYNNKCPICNSKLYLARTSPYYIQCDKSIEDGWYCFYFNCRLGQDNFYLKTFIDDIQYSFDIENGITVEMTRSTNNMLLVCEPNINKPFDYWVDKIKDGSIKDILKKYSILCNWK